jgi:hypothetical protein
MRQLFFKVLLITILITGSGYAFSKPYISVTKDSLTTGTRRVSGSGDVRYTGDAKSVRSSTSGSGNVSKY